MTVHRNLDAILPAWREFEATALGTLYQNSLWCRAWLDTVGQARQRSPPHRDGSVEGCLRILVPLQIRTRLGVRVLEWLGSPHHNYGYPLLDPGFAPEAAAWFSANWSGIVAAIGGIDAVTLTENPVQFFGLPHPMAALFNLRGANPVVLGEPRPRF